jgi:alpha-N-acetylglucosamine transferase
MIAGVALLFVCTIIFTAAVAEGGRQAFATLVSSHTADVTSDFYFLSARLLISKLKDKDVIVIVVPETNQAKKEILRNDGAIIHEVSGALRAAYTPKGLSVKEQYIDQFVKIALWNLTQYDQILYLDSDLWVRTPNINDLFHITSGIEFSATYDSGLDDLKFNAGLFMLTPSEKRYRHMVSLLNSSRSWFGGTADQDFLNWYFGKSYFGLDKSWNLQHVVRQNDEQIRTAKIIHCKFWIELRPDNHLYKEWFSELIHFKL